MIANFCENSTYGIFTFDRIPAGKYGSSQQRCDKNTSNGMCFSKHLLFRHMNRYVGSYLSSLQLVLSPWRRHQRRFCGRVWLPFIMPMFKVQDATSYNLIPLKTVIWISYKFLLILLPLVYFPSFIYVLEFEHINI